MRNLLILGAGGYGKTVADVARQLGWTVQGFLDDHASGDGVLGKCDKFLSFADGETAMYPAFGNNAVRMSWLTRLKEAGIPVPALIHPAAYVSPTAGIADGTVVLPMAVVNTGCAVGEGCIVNIGVMIDHDCVLEPGVHLAPGVVVKAENRIPSCEKIESGTVIQNREYPL